MIGKVMKIIDLPIIGKVIKLIEARRIRIRLNRRGVNKKVKLP